VKIGILGAGSWAIALSALLDKRGHQMVMWEFNPKDAAMLTEKREHAIKLPGIKIPASTIITNTLREAVSSVEMVICAVPAQTLRATMKLLVKNVPEKERDAVQGWIIVAKGIECGTMKLLSEVLVDEIPGLNRNKILILSGPSHAEEVSREMPTTVVAACEDISLSERIQQEFTTEVFRIYTNTDVIGVELAGSVKNVIAIAAGICDGLGLGDNSKGALLTRGLAEIIRLGEKMGGRLETFSGLAGIGDLITTCISRHSRNRKFGELIGQGLSYDETMKRMVMVAEGVETTKSTHQLAEKLSVEMPITEQVYLTLFQGKPAIQAVKDLMMRQSKPERWQ
jgi:glycerol-3-phosphate dehydrogenase (NAD(P)+)